MTAAAFPFHERLIDCLVVTLVIGGMAWGSRAGFFRSTVAAIVALATFFTLLALWCPLTRWLTHMEVPSSIAPSVALILLLAATASAIRRLQRLTIPLTAMRLSREVDLVGGSLLGVVTGAVTAGITLVALSLLPAMAWAWADPQGVRLDAGAAMLTAFAQCAAADREAAMTLLYGEPFAGDVGSTSIASETFIDLNRDGWRDADEAFLDADGDHAFSPRLPFLDPNANGRRDIGLLERYRLGCWELVTMMPGDPATPGDGGPGAADRNGPASP